MVFATQDRDLFLPADPRNLLAAWRACESCSLHLTSFGEPLEAWEERTSYELAGVEIPVARLKHIVVSKAAAGRDKDRLFLATHAEALRELLAPDDSGG